METKTSPWTVFITILLTAGIVGGGVYYWQTQVVTEKTMPSEKTETTQNDLTLSVSQQPLGPSTIQLRDAYSEGSGFSLEFPSSWGFVSVKKSNLTDSDGAPELLPQIASYTFASEFQPQTYSFTIIISKAKFKDNPLVTQQNRIFLAEDSNYYYNYNSSTEFCVVDGICKEEEVAGINTEIQSIMSSFKLL